MKTRPLGRSGLTVSALGLGCMGMSEFYGPTDEAEALATLDAALDCGITFLDTADMYGPFTNEALLGRFLAGKRDRVVVATKFGIVRTADPDARGVDNRPAYIRAACEGSLARLGIEAIDLYYVHRVDRLVPIEETVGALADLVREGKIRAIGLSEVTADTLRRADAVHPIAAVQSEYSLITRDPEENGVLAACRDLGIAFVAYSPLGRGLLTGTLPPAEDLAPDDFRRGLPRHTGDGYAANRRLIAALEAIAEAVGASPAQVALAWAIRAAPVIAIPGARRRSRLADIAAAAALDLGADALAALDAALPPGAAVGARYTPQGMALLDG